MFYYIDTTDLPQEAGLMFACRSSTNFIGKDKLNAKARKRRATFIVPPEVPLNGTEPIYRYTDAKKVYT